MRNLSLSACFFLGLLAILLQKSPIPFLPFTVKIPIKPFIDFMQTVVNLFDMKIFTEIDCISFVKSFLFFTPSTVLETLHNQLVCTIPASL